MKRISRLHIYNQLGFALPTILIASVIMMIALVTSITAVSSIASGLANQYYNQIAREAAEAGLVNARVCLRTGDYTPSWTTASPLRPNTNCSGVVQGSLDQWMVNSGNVRAAFTVPLPEAGAAGAVRVAATGTVQLVRASNPSQVWRTFTVTLAENSRYNDLPQLAGGAGWKSPGETAYSGHNGYMLASNGTLYGWGANERKQLSDTLGDTVATPVKIDLPSGVSRAKQIANSGQGASILCILATHTSDGDQVYCRGTEGLGDVPFSGWVRFGLGSGLAAKDLEVNGYGSNSVCVLASDLQMYCAGLNVNGALGNGTTSAAPVPINNPTRFRLDLANPAPPAGTTLPLTVKKIFNKDRISCVIASDDRAYCAGDNSAGQLGQGTTSTNVDYGKSIPGRAMLPSDRKVADIRLSYHSGSPNVFFQDVEGNINVSGANDNGVLNDGSFGGAYYTTPQQITNGAQFGKMFSIGERGDYSQTLCIISTSPAGGNDSGLWCHGRNTYGQIGRGTCTQQAAWVSMSYVGGAAVNYRMSRESDYQMNSMMVIATNGDVYAAGDNTFGKLGTGGTLQACNANYTKVALPAGVTGVALANGDEYTAFILGSNGRIYAMGRNNNGQLGDGTTTNRSTPVEVKVPRQATIY